MTSEPGVHDAVAGGGVTVVRSSSVDDVGVAVTVHRSGQVVGEITSNASRPRPMPRPTFMRAGAREIRTVVLPP